MADATRKRWWDDLFNKKKIQSAKIHQDDGLRISVTVVMMMMAWWEQIRNLHNSSSIHFMTLSIFTPPPRFDSWEKIHRHERRDERRLGENWKTSMTVKVEKRKFLRFFRTIRNDSTESLSEGWRVCTCDILITKKNTKTSRIASNLNSITMKFCT